VTIRCFLIGALDQGGDKHRPPSVILSAAKDLSPGGRRSFAALRMTAVLP
jgi:hypothetical protein